jgi:DNA repair protein SbcC/Rad50
VKLKRLAINRLPGISQPFQIEAAGAGFNVVYGPNGIGKSSLCRAVEGFYWEDRGPSLRTSVSGEFELDGESLWVEREGSRVRWQRGGEDCVQPSLPASHNHRCFFLRLRDLIDPSSDGTQDIASEIRRQMSGGFDLDHIAADLFANLGAQHGRRERRDFNKAFQEVQEEEGKQSGLQRRADQLDALQAQLSTAESSAERLIAVDRALGLAERLEEYAGVTNDLAFLPNGAEKLTGKEVEQIEGFREQIDELDDRARTLEGQRDTARDAKRGSRLAAPLGKADLAIWREKAGELGRVELALQAARTEHSARRKELAAALSSIGGGNVDDVELDLSDHVQLFEFLRAVEAHKARTNAINERMRLLAHVDRPEDSQGDLDTSRSAADILRSWLRAPEPESLSTKLRTRRPWILVALAIVVAGAALAVFVHPMFVLLAAAGAGIALPVFVLGKSTTSSGTRVNAQDAFAKLVTVEPEAWDVASVELRLRRLEGEIATVDSRLQRARDRGVERQALESELSGLSEVEAALGAKRKKLTGSLKLDEIPPDAELVDFARALDQLRSARIKDESAAGTVDDLETKHRERLSDLATVLERSGEPQPHDAKTAGAYLNSLADRNTMLVQAISDEERATNLLGQVSTDRGKALNSIKQIYAELSLNDGDMLGLTTLLNSLPNYRKLKSAATRLEPQIALDTDALTKAQEASLADCNRPALERLKSDLLQSADKVVGLRNEIAEINAQVKEAKRGGNVQELIASREDARTKLLDRRDEALFARAGKFLIDSVEQEYEQTQMPRVFERARSHFSTFTHHNYDLRLGGEAHAARLIAIDLSNGEGRKLDELSDGTRAQLLLAARIAFAEEVEQGRTLPLFLDEALDQSDPGRFEAIVRSLGRVATEQNRQIFYLTSDPLDLDRIRLALAKDNYEIAVAIDLGLVRRQAASVSEPLALKVEPRPAIPAAEGLTAEEYGFALGVPVFAPALGYSQQHFFYVLSDDLDLLHEFLVRGIERVGQWKTVSDTALAEKMISPSISSSEITFRVDLLEVFCELWKQGRGRPVDREVLEKSGALSDRFLDAVEEIAGEQGADPARLLGVLGTSKDLRLRNFRQRSVVSLEQYLRDNGYLDDRPVLSADELRLLAFATPAAHKLRTDVASACLNRWWTLAARTVGT